MQAYIYHITFWCNCQEQWSLASWPSCWTATTQLIMQWQQDAGTGTISTAKEGYANTHVYMLHIGSAVTVLTQIVRDRQTGRIQTRSGLSIFSPAANGKTDMPLKQYRVLLTHWVTCMSPWWIHTVGPITQHQDHISHTRHSSKHRKHTN